jgi:HEAT repeat protein
VRKRALIVAAGVIVVAIVAVMVWPGADRDEPGYRGKKLSEWLTLYGYGNDKEHAAAVIAVQTIGTNGLPWLLKWRNYEGTTKLSTWRRKAVSALDRLPLRLAWRVRLRRYAGGPGDMRGEALWGFGILGSEAKPAVPELSRLAKDPTSSEWSCYALGKIGATSVAALIQLIEDRANPARFDAFRYIGTDAEKRREVAAVATPSLLRMLEDGNSRIVLDAAYTLARLDSEPDHARAALVRCLSDSDHNIRYSAARSLAALGRDARPAIPDLVERLNDPNARVRSGAATALRIVAPEVLTNRVTDGHE